MKYFLAYLSATQRLLFAAGAFYLLLRHDRPLAFYLIYLSMIGGIAGPISLLINKKEEVKKEVA